MSKLKLDTQPINIPWNNTPDWGKIIACSEHEYRDDETKCAANIVGALARKIVHENGTPNPEVVDIYLQTLLSAVASYAYAKGYADAAQLAAEVIRL